MTDIGQLVQEFTALFNGKRVEITPICPGPTNLPPPRLDSPISAIAVFDNPLREKMLTLEMPIWLVDLIRKAVVAHLHNQKVSSVYDLVMSSVFHPDPENNHRPTDSPNVTEAYIDGERFRLFSEQHILLNRLRTIACEIEFPAVRWITFPEPQVRFTMPYSFVYVIRRALLDVSTVVEFCKHLNTPSDGKPGYWAGEYKVSDFLVDLTNCFRFVIALYKPTGLFPSGGEEQ